MRKRTQADHVQEEKERNYKPTVTQLKLPGIATLHTKPAEDIALALTNVFRSQPNIKELRWVVGEYIELTSDPLDQ